MFTVYSESDVDVKCEMHSNIGFQNRSRVLTVSSYVDLAESCFYIKGLCASFHTRIHENNKIVHVLTVHIIILTTTRFQ